MCHSEDRPLTPFHNDLLGEQGRAHPGDGLLLLIVPVSKMFFPVPECPGQSVLIEKTAQGAVRCALPISRVKFLVAQRGSLSYIECLGKDNRDEVEYK